MKNKLDLIQEVYKIAESKVEVMQHEQSNSTIYYLPVYGIFNVHGIGQDDHWASFDFWHKLRRVIGDATQEYIESVLCVLKGEPIIKLKEIKLTFDQFPDNGMSSHAVANQLSKCLMNLVERYNMQDLEEFKTHLRKKLNDDGHSYPVKREIVLQIDVDTQKRINFIHGLFNDMSLDQLYLRLAVWSVSV